MRARRPIFALESRHETSRPNEVTFHNELKNEIKVAVYEEPIDGVKGVMIFIQGPTSDTENHITRMEAEEIYKQLGKVLGN